MSNLGTGKLLLADPFMLDNNFKKSVILLADHSPVEGTVGFVLNRPTNLSMNDLIFDFPSMEAKVYYGGPVGPDTIHYVHKLGDRLHESRKISEGLFWSGNFEELKSLIKQNQVVIEDIRFFIGYSGWEPGQLNEEMKSQSWIIADADDNYIFNMENDVKWSEVMSNKGGHFKVIAEMSDNISLN